jgi:hypothetical protein
MKCFYNNRQILLCKDCPFFLQEEIENTDFVESFCTPVKDKYGYNPIDHNTKAGEKDFCRLTNEVTVEFVLNFGAFSGKTVAEVMEIAPRYIKVLEEKNVIKIVS